MPSNRPVLRQHRRKAPARATRAWVVPAGLLHEQHWCSSGFANTDLDQQLKVHGIHRLIVIGLLANMCVEATVRFAAELGYDVTLVKDATASFSEEQMHVALDINLPNYANAIVTASEIIEAISPVSANSSGSLTRARPDPSCAGGPAR